MVGLVIDGGLLMATYRHAQNAADAAALLGANQQLQVLQGSLATTNTATVAAIVTSGTAGNNLTNAKVAVTFGYRTLLRDFRGHQLRPSRRHCSHHHLFHAGASRLQSEPVGARSRPWRASSEQPLNAGVLTLGSDRHWNKRDEGLGDAQAPREPTEQYSFNSRTALPPFPFRQIATPFKPQICKSSAAPSAMQARSSARCKPAWRRPPNRTPLAQAGHRLRRRHRYVRRDDHYRNRQRRHVEPRNIQCRGRDRSFRPPAPSISSPVSTMSPAA